MYEGPYGESNLWLSDLLVGTFKSDVQAWPDHLAFY
jgi:hypothetical protein